MAGFPEYLSEQGWDVHVVSAGRPATPPTTWTAHALPMRREPSPIFDLFSLARWVKLLLTLRPALVVAGTPKAGLLGMLAAAVTRTPRRVYLLRGLRLSTESGPRRRLLEVLERVAITAATEVQSVSHSLREEVVELGLAPRDKVTVVAQGSSNGVSVPAADEAAVPAARRRAELGLSERPTIGFVGRMHADKGLPDLLRAFAHSASGSEAQLLLIGPEEPVGYLQELLDGLDAPDRERVTWVRRVDEPAPYYRAMDALALPTKREGFPNVVLEAAAHGVPTIASDVTGCRDAIVDGSTGVLVPHDDVHALAAAMTRAVDNPDRTRAMGARARDRVQQEFERHHVWSQLDSYYRSATTQPTGDMT
ncbi:glycosyltransferase family 4 protein [Janibacter anophelis]|uniref:glycosyltransferase family 4 protein n=1 Tax=Janibacter anophelis TaxID=319054 RepID=UPI0013B06158|nr:glycosyltransferase family 4 protein [Janibacter anophelis]